MRHDPDASKAGIGIGAFGVVDLCGPSHSSQVLQDGQEIVVGNVTFRVYLSDWAHTKTDAMIEVVEE